MTLNQLKLLYPYCACHTKKEMHSRDTTDLMLQLVSVLFFDLATIVLTLLENPNFLVYLFANFFWIIMTIIIIKNRVESQHQDTR